MLGRLHIAVVIVGVLLAAFNVPAYGQDCTAANENQLVFDADLGQLKACKSNAWQTIILNSALGNSIGSDEIEDAAVQRKHLGADGCTNGQILKQNSSGEWICAADAVGLTSVGAGDITDDAVGLNKLDGSMCSDGEVLKHNGTSWACSKATEAFPYQVTLYPADASVLTGNAMVTVSDTDQFNTFYSNQDPAADGDTLEWQFKLASGTYDVEVLGIEFTTRGMVDWYLNGNLVEPAQDWYDGSLNYNVRKTFPITVATGGDQTLRAVVNGQNPSSTDYFFLFTRIQIKE